MNAPIRQFRAHTEAGDSHAPSAVVDASSFEDAALTFLESFSHAGEEMRVTVRDNQTGEQHCFALQHDGALSEGC